RLATHEWSGGAVDPDGYVHLESFILEHGLPRWRWSVGDVVLEATLAMAHGRPAVGVLYRLVRAPAPVRLEVGALCTWRDAHGGRCAYGSPAMEVTADGFAFEGAYRVRGPAFSPVGEWAYGARYRAEAERGLNDREDLFLAGRFEAVLAPGEAASVEAWSGALGAPAPPAAEALISHARERSAAVVASAGAADEVEAALALAADQFVVAGPAVVAGYPWFGDWSRDTMTSYEGLFLATGRFDEGRALLLRAAATVSEGMLANTADSGATEYNTVDAAMWFLHAVDRHVAVAGDLDLAAAVAGELEGIVRRHLAGTRFGIRVDPADGLVTQGAPGWALTWMDARVDGVPATPRAGKPVEVNALWCSGLAGLAELQRRLGRDASVTDALAAQARASFAARFPRPGGAGLYDVVDGPAGDDASLRPN
ncbi:MAG: amylo-alpha-1,6-glucosidase, partial [Acidimicrobiales bacterium]